MEKFLSDSGLKDLQNELTQGGELAKQLQFILNFPQSSPPAVIENLLKRILNSYDRSMAILQHGSTGGGAFSVPDFPRWPVVPGGGGGGIISDQEDLAFRKREHSSCQTCLATTQVQISDKDPKPFEGLHRRDNNQSIPMIESQCQTQQESSFNIQTSLTDISQDLDSIKKQSNIPSSSDINPNNNFIVSEDDSYWDDFLCKFTSHPMSPESNYFNSYEMLAHDSHDTESELSKIVGDEPRTLDHDFSKYFL